MTTVEELQMQVQAQRQQLEQRRAEAEAQQQRLEQAKKSLPSTTSQQSLRQKYSGIQGIIKRKAIEKYSQAIGSKSQEVEAYKQELNQYETQTLRPAEVQISEYKAQEQAYNEDVRAFNKAKELYLERIPYSYVSDEKTQNYLKKFYEAGTMADKTQAKIQEDLNARIESVNTGSQTFEQAFPKQYLQKLERSGIKITSPSEVPSGQYQSIPPELNREDKEKLKPYTNLMNGFSTFSLASAQEEQVSQTNIPPEQLQSVPPQKSVFVKVYERNVPAPVRLSLSAFGIGSVPEGTPPIIRSAIGRDVNFQDRERARRVLEAQGFSPTNTAIEQEALKQAQSRFTGYSISNPLAFVEFGAVSIPKKLTPTMQPQTDFLGTIEKLDDGSRIRVVSRTTQGGQESFGLAESFVKGTDTEFGSISQGYTFKIERGKFKDVKPLVSLSEGQVGKGALAKDYKYLTESPQGLLGGEIKTIKKSVEFGEGYLARTNTLIQKKRLLNGRLRVNQIDRDVSGFVTRGIGEENQANLFIGGKPLMRINKKTGQVTYIVKKEDVNVRGLLYNAPTTTTEETTIFGQRLSTSQKTPLSLTFEEKKQVTGLVSSLKKAGEKAVSKAPKNIKGKGGEQLYDSSGTSLFTTGLFSGSVSREFTGDISGTFSRSFNKGLTGQAVTRRETSAFTGQTIRDLSESFTGQGSQLRFFQGSDNRQLERVSLEIQQKPKQDLFPSTSQRPKQELTPLERLNLRINQDSRVDLKVNQEFRQATKQKTPQKTQTKTPRVPTPKTPLLALISKKVKSGEKVEDLFEVTGRRFGKELEIGEFGTQSEAEEAFTKFAKSGLGRSGTIKYKGEKIPFERLRLTNEFTPSKREKGRIVQRSKFALSSSGEKAEIKSAKKNPFTQKGKKAKSLRF